MFRKLRRSRFVRIEYEDSMGNDRAWSYVNPERAIISFGDNGDGRTWVMALVRWYDPHRDGPPIVYVDMSVEDFRKLVGD